MRDWLCGMLVEVVDAEDGDDDVFDPGEGGRQGSASDCPLSGYDVDAVPWSVPEALAKVAAEAAGGQGGDGSAAQQAARVWCTLLGVATLAALDECYLRARAGREETVVDAATAWLQKQAAASAPLAEAMPELELAAQAQVALWRKRQRINSRASRAAWVENRRVRTVTDVERALGTVAQGLCKGHETWSIPLGSPAMPVTRWQSVLLLFLSFAVMLCVDIW